MSPPAVPQALAVIPASQFIFQITIISQQSSRTVWTIATRLHYAEQFVAKRVSDLDDHFK